MIILRVPRLWQRNQFDKCLFSRAVASHATCSSSLKHGRKPETIAAEAESAAAALNCGFLAEEARKQVARCLTEAGQPARGESVARSISRPETRAVALAEVARCQVVAPQAPREALASQAEETACSIGRPFHRAVTLAQVTEILTASGLRQPGSATALEAEETARLVERPDLRTQAMTQIARLFAVTGMDEHGEALAAEAETAAPRIR